MLKIYLYAKYFPRNIPFVSVLLVTQQSSIWNESIGNDCVYVCACAFVGVCVCWYVGVCESVRLCWILVMESKIRMIWWEMKMGNFTIHDSKCINVVWAWEICQNGKNLFCGKWWGTTHAFHFTKSTLKISTFGEINRSHSIRMYFQLYVYVCYGNLFYPSHSSSSMSYKHTQAL